MLGGETYAMGILEMKEIIEYGNLTEVPRMPQFIRGVINLRGAVMPVIDLSSRFGKQATKVTRRTCIVIIEVAGEHEQQDVGVMVDAVNAVLEIPPQEIEPPPSFGANIRADFINGMGKVNGKFVIILNIQHVLSVDEMASLSGIEANDSVASAQTIQNKKPCPKRRGIYPFIHSKALPMFPIRLVSRYLLPFLLLLAATVASGKIAREVV